MEHIDAVYHDDDAQDLPKDQKPLVYGDIEQAIALLHQNGFIFGDLRNGNLLAMQGKEPLKARLIDFDWAGKCNETRWSLMMNNDLNWPKGARGGDFIGKADDKYML
ncbi:hypothetical protein FISHEDRAFT_40740 [Fistulina hepatica ATCC 64428]|uniref:Protein kinase domain-containing protein n=1 Tax=Fistulina hepatica ATCC 64428 TaxID=1128425 RepID=A0A0D7AH00_9AGAR|nr:hypothetical protein FISHEDRAFT_40740 [Fistulina hepatica ATCC 64428]